MGIKGASKRDITFAIIGMQGCYRSSALFLGVLALLSLLFGNFNWTFFTVALVFGFLWWCFTLTIDKTVDYIYKVSR